jgi:hypothetical protein
LFSVKNHGLIRSITPVLKREELLFRFKFLKLVPVLGALIALVDFSAVALATTVTGSPPPAVLTNGSAEDANIQIFTESTGVVLAAPLTVGTTTIPAGRYNSFLVHYDPSGDSGTASGTIEFDSNISFVLETTAELTGSDSIFGTGATYQVDARQTGSVRTQGMS